MIFDTSFLLDLDKQKHKIIYAKITALKFDETPIETIEGRVTQGSINIDGASAVRRSCSLTLTTKDFRYNNYYWSLHTKFKLEIGIENHISTKYPKIIWFNQGTYLITSFSSSLTTNNFTIQISGKDKMALLNGEIGGSIGGTTDFGSIDEENEKGEWVNRKLTIYEIIREAVHTYAKEPYHNIVIKDLDIQGLELLEYRDEKNPLYLCRKKDEIVYNHFYKDGKKPCFVYFSDQNNNVGSFIKKTTLEELQPTDLDILINPLFGTNYPKLIKFNEDPNFYYVSKIEYGQTAGYRNTDLVFPKDLIANVGETITSVFDKIIQTMFNDYEYFYNLDGQFVFQKKQIYINTPWTPIKQSNEEFYVDSVNESTQYSYSFNDATLINTFNNNPNILNLRNDYSISGKRKSIDGSVEIPILMRYAIDEKPEQYTCIEIEDDNEDLIRYNKKNNLNYSGQKMYTYSTEKYDWREIIYQMASDYYKYGQLDDFYLRVAAANGDLYPNGITGYEQYYIDIKSFWRELYNPFIYYDTYKKNEKIEKKVLNLENLEKELKSLEKELENLEGEEKVKKEEEKNNLQSQIEKIKSEIVEHENYYYYSYDKKNNIIYKNQVLGEAYSDQYKRMKDIKNNKIVYAKSIMPKMMEKIPIFDDFLITSAIDKKEKKKVINFSPDENGTINKNVYIKGAKVTYSDSNLYWNKTVFENPENLNFWFDFLDQGQLQSFSVSSIGNRPKAVNDQNVKSIYFRETPDVIFIKDNEEKGQFGYKYIQYENIDEDFSVSAQGKSAKNKLDELLYQHGCVIENATITTIPIYYLQPNTRIHIYDEKTNLNGDYIINKISMPLTYNGNMSITATKVIENLM